MEGLEDSVNKAIKAAMKEFKADLDESKAEIREMRTRLNEKDNEILVLRTRLNEKDNEILALRTRLNEKDDEQLEANTTNTLKNVLKRIGKNLDEKNWYSALENLCDGVEKRQIVVSPLERYSFEEIQQVVKMFQLWKSKRDQRNNLYHQTITTEQIPNSVLTPYLNIINKYN